MKNLKLGLTGKLISLELFKLNVEKLVLHLMVMQKLEQLFADPQMRVRMGEEASKSADRMASSVNAFDQWELLLANVAKK